MALGVARMPVYPEQVDALWVAADQHGAVAVFLTAGEAPIPAALLIDKKTLESIEGALVELPKISKAQLLADVPWPENFIFLAERGLYVFNWTDVHRSMNEDRSMYEVVAKPRAPALLVDLPEQLQSLIRSVGVFDDSFLESGWIDPTKYSPCMLPERHFAIVQGQSPSAKP